MSMSLVRLGGLSTLAKELPVHGDEQLLAVLAEAPIAADSLDHVQADLVVPACDRQVAEQPRQCARLQFQGTLQARDVRGDGQRTPALPLRRRRLADARSATQRVQRQPPSDARLPEDSAELILLRCGRQALCSLVRAAAARSIAQWPADRASLLVASYSSLDDLSLLLYDLPWSPPPEAWSWLTPGGHPRRRRRRCGPTSRTVVGVRRGRRPPSLYSRRRSWARPADLATVVQELSPSPVAPKGFPIMSPTP